MGAAAVEAKREREHRRRPPRHPPEEARGDDLDALAARELVDGGWGVVGEEGGESGARGEGEREQRRRRERDGVGQLRVAEVVHERGQLDAYGLEVWRCGAEGAIRVPADVCGCCRVRM